MSQDSGGLAAAVAAVLITAAILIPGIYLADRAGDRIKVEVRQRDLLARTEPGSIAILQVLDPLPVREPFAPAWDAVPEVAVAMAPQTIAAPMLEMSTIQTVAVQAASDGERMYIRLRWEDPSPDMNVDVARFSDAVAIQLPLSDDAPFTMGGPGSRVQILHWKGLWQLDVDEHFQDVQDLHPNYWTDLYWFAEGEFPYPVPEAFADTVSHQWFPAYQAGNPVADFHRREPVEELAAEGYGSLTTHAETVTAGAGAWRDGEWAVVFVRPLRTDDAQDFQFHPGQRATLSLAVWEGSAANVGGRKHYSNWIRFEVQS